MIPRNIKCRNTTQRETCNGDDEEKSDRDKDGITDVVDDTRDLIDLLKTKNISADDIIFIENKNGRHDFDSWSKAFPQFLIWAAGK